MRRYLLVSLGLLLACAAVVLLRTPFVLGVGFFDQEIMIESNKTIERVSYCSWTVDAETRIRAEAAVDPGLFDCREASKLAERRFQASITFTTQSGLLWSELYHPEHLVLYVEFSDGSRCCRVVDVPPGRGKDAISLRIQQE
jgi:hypothetical protein